MPETVRRVTIDDVAKLARVSRVTVSYVLNGRQEDARIADATAERVRLAARDLGYRPNGLARRLVAKRTHTLAVAFQYAGLFASGSGFITALMEGVSRAATDLGYDLMLHTRPPQEGEDDADVLMDGRCDGVLLLRDANDVIASRLADRGFPCCLFFCQTDDPRVSFVDADNVAGARLAVEHLRGLGHRCLGLVHGDSASLASRLRLQGFREATADLQTVECVMGWPGENPACVLDAMRRPDRPTAWFVWSDDVALELMRTLQREGWRIPEDVSFVGFDSLPVSERSTPPLTSVRQPISDIAFQATQMLAKLIEGDSGPQRMLQSLVLDCRASVTSIFADL